MADVFPDYALEKMRMRVQLGQLQQNRLTAEFRVMQLSADLAKAQAAMSQMDAAIAEQEHAIAVAPDGPPEDDGSVS